MTENGGSNGLFADWNRFMRKVHAEPIEHRFAELESIPRFTDKIIDEDVQTLIEIAGMVGVEIEDFEALYDKFVFSQVKGKILREIYKDILWEKLRPGNPMEDQLRNIANESQDLKTLVKNILGGEDDKSTGV